MDNLPVAAQVKTMSLPPSLSKHQLLIDLQWGESGPREQVPLCDGTLMGLTLSKPCKVVSTAGNSKGQTLSCLKDRAPQHSTIFLPLTLFLLPLPQCSLSLGRSDIEVPLKIGSLVTYSQHFMSLCIYYKNKLLQLKLIAAVICEHKHKYLGGNLTGTLCWFSKQH